MSRVLGFLVIVCLIVSCSDNHSEKDVSTEDFNPPKIISTQYSGKENKSVYVERNVSGVFPEFMGKYEFQNQIDINPSTWDTNFRSDYRDVRLWMGLDDSLDVNGFEMMVDYETTVYYNPYYQHDSTLYAYFPVYMVNSTRTKKLFLGKDSHAFGIQEAQQKNDYNKWHPIEHKGFDFCGNGNWGLVVKPNEFVLILVRKYAGDYETKMRVRIALDASVYVSKPYIGLIDSNQFVLEDSSYVQARLNETNGLAASWLFYGAIPQEEEWVVATY